MFVGFCLFLKNYWLIVAGLSKQKALNADSRTIQQITFTGKIKSTVADTRVIIHYIHKQSKETKLKEQQKFCNQYKLLNTVKYMLSCEKNNWKNWKLEQLWEWV